MFTYRMFGTIHTLLQTLLLLLHLLQHLRRFFIQPGHRNRMLEHVIIHKNLRLKTTRVFYGSCQRLFREFPHVTHAYTTNTKLAPTAAHHAADLVIFVPRGCAYVVFMGAVVSFVEVVVKVKNN